MHVVTFVLYVCVFATVCVCACVCMHTQLNVGTFVCVGLSLCACVCVQQCSHFSFVVCSTNYYGAGLRAVQVQKSGVRA